MESLCRLCGKKYESTIDNFREDQEIHSKITKVLQIMIRPEDDLPKLICSECRNRLDDAFNFINCCHDTQHRLEGLRNTRKNLLSVQHTNHVSENFLSKSALYPLNNANNTDDLFSKSDADSKNLVFPSHIKTVKITFEIENRSPEANISQEFPLQLMGKNTYLIAEGNNDLKPGQVNAAMESEFGTDYLFGDTCTNSDIRNDMKENTKKEYKMNVRSLASKLKTCKRARTAKHRMTKISKNNQKKKILNENRGDFDYLAGLELAREQKKWTCDTCKMTFTQENIYQEHLAVHSGNRPYSCKICASSFRKRQELNQHLRTEVHSDKQNKLASTHDYNAKKVLEKFFLCDFCTYHTDEKEKIRQHVTDKHKGNLSFMCEICGLAFKTLPSLQAHKVNVHVSESKVCQKCKAVCSSFAEYRVHMLSCGKKNKCFARDKYCTGSTHVKRSS